MGSVSLPVIFSPVKYKNYLLVDGGVLDDFPVALAKQKYPNQEVIGVTLSKFKEEQPVTNIISTTLVCFNLIFSKKLEETKKLTDHLFYKETGISVTENNAKKLHKIYDQGYQDAFSYFSVL
jgi:NTE family protein